MPRGAGSSLFSPLFTAAGVRDILFEFYPNGSAVTASEGFCGSPPATRTGEAVDDSGYEAQSIQSVTGVEARWRGP